MFHVQYDRPHYVTVVRNSFNTNEVEIRLNSGYFVPFERGKLILVLHFRRRQILLIEELHCSKFSLSLDVKMFVPYECCTQRYTEHHQTGSGLPHYRGQLYQKGYGLGGFFRNLFHSAIPLFTKGLKTVGKEAFRTGTLIASDVLSGEKFKSAAKQRTKEAGKVLAQKAIRKAS